MYIDLRLKYPLFLSDFIQTNFLCWSEKSSDIKYHIIRLVGAGLLHADGHTWRNGRVAFSSVANAPRIQHLHSVFFFRRTSEFRLCNGWGRNSKWSSWIIWRLYCWFSIFVSQWSKQREHDFADGRRTWDRIFATCGRRVFALHALLLTVGLSGVPVFRLP